jgi:hypothetical protein
VQGPEIHLQYCQKKVISHAIYDEGKRVEKTRKKPSKKFCEPQSFFHALLSPVIQTEEHAIWRNITDFSEPERSLRLTLMFVKGIDELSASCELYKFYTYILLEPTEFTEQKYTECVVTCPNFKNT